MSNNAHARETDLVNAVMQLITLKGGKAIRVNSGVMVLEDSTGKKRVFKGAEKGTSDVIACYRGRFLAIECKIEHNKPSDEQVRFLDQVAEADGIGMVLWDNTDCLQKVMESLDREQ